MATTDVRKGKAHCGQTLRGARAMRAAILSGALDTALETTLRNRVTAYTSYIQNVAQPSVIQAVVLVEAYRDGQATPFRTVTSFDYATLVAAIQTALADAYLDDAGVIYRPNGDRYGYVVVWAEESDATRVNVTTELISQVSAITGGL